MTLKRKIGLQMLGGVLGVLVLAQAVQFVQTHRSNAQLAGLKMSTSVGADLETIVQQIRQVDDLIAQVAAASQEQSKGIDQLNAALAELDKVTRSNTENAGQNAQSAARLNQHIQTVGQACRALQDLVHGGATKASTVPPADQPPAPRTGRRTAPALTPSQPRNGRHIPDLQLEQR